MTREARPERLAGFGDFVAALGALVAAMAGVMMMIERSGDGDPNFAPAIVIASIAALLILCGTIVIAGDRARLPYIPPDEMPTSAASSGRPEG